MTRTLTEAAPDEAAAVSSLPTAALVELIEAEPKIFGARSLVLQDELKRRAIAGDPESARHCADMISKWHADGLVSFAQWAPPAEGYYRLAAESGEDRDAVKLAGFLLQVVAFTWQRDGDLAVTALVEAMTTLSSLINRGVDKWDGIDLVALYRVTYNDAPPAIQQQIDLETAIGTERMLDPKPEPEVLLKANRSKED